MSRRSPRLSGVACAAAMLALTASVFIACSSSGANGGENESGGAHDAGSAGDGVSGEGGPAPDSGASTRAEPGDDTDAGGDGGPVDDREDDSCTAAEGTYTVRYTQTFDADSGCLEADSGTTITMESYPAPSDGDAGTQGDGGALTGCTCTGTTLACTFNAILRGVSTSTTTLSETFTANGWTGTVSDEVNLLDGGVHYSCTQSVNATKN